MEIGMLGGIAGAVGGWLAGSAYRSWKYKRERKHGLKNEFHDLITVKAAIVWRDDEGDKRWHLSIRDVQAKVPMLHVFANRPITDVVRAASDGTKEGLVRVANPVIHRRMMDLIRRHFTGNDLAALYKFLTGRHVRRDKIIFGLLSPRHKTANGDAELFRLGMASILLIHEERLDILCRPDFLDFIALGKSATRTDAELVHKIALSAPEELKKKPGLAALAIADVESEDEEHLADQVAQKVLAQLATTGLVRASR
jgi:hypothetical protein